MLHSPVSWRPVASLEQAPSRRSEHATSQLLRQISMNVGQMDRLLTDVADLQRLGWGAMALDRRPFDIAALLEREAARWRTDRGWPQVSTTSATVWLDPDKVERILHELLANVAKHTPPNTPVWMRTRRNGAGILLLVDDAGPGLPRELRLSAFERLPGSGNTLIHSPAVGIGLSLVLRLAELHGGPHGSRIAQGVVPPFRFCFQDRLLRPLTLALSQHYSAEIDRWPHA
jgi:signal transduction histidine kinase